MKKSRLSISILIFAVIMVFCSIINDNVYADSIKSGLTVSPPNQKIILIPGEEYTGTIRISSPASSQRDVNYTITIGPFSEHGKEGGNDDYGEVDYVSVSSYNQMMNWITLNKTKGTVSPNESQTIIYTINVPKDAPAGGQYASLIVRDETSGNSSGSGVSIKSNMQASGISKYPSGFFSSLAVLAAVLE